MEKYKGKLTLGNKEYECEVIDGVRYIDGKTVDEFYNELPIEEVIKLVRVGFEALKAEKNGEAFSPKEEYQRIIVGVHLDKGKKYLDSFNEVFQVNTPKLTRDLLVPAPEEAFIPFTDKVLAMYSKKEKFSLNLSKEIIHIYSYSYSALACVFALANFLLFF